jgi:CDP-6-deoxy-D-xylo-4-hexulose-3-dehydrase
MWKLAEDTISVDEVHGLAEWLKTGPRLTQGDQVREFEERWSRWQGTAHSVFVSSGTTANLAAVLAAAERVPRRQPRIGVAAVTWSTNVTPSLLLGHEVVLFDVRLPTLGLDTDQVVTAMDAGEIDILFLTHLLGFNGLDERILSSAQRNGVVLLEDCCEAHGAEFRGQKVGSFGLASTFSFYFGHHMSTIEGGMVCTNDDDLADALRLIRAHGLARESRWFGEYAAQNPSVDPRFLFVKAGLNFRSSEINAWLGQSQLLRLDERIGQRNRNLRAFLENAPDLVYRDFLTQGVSSFALPLIARDREAARRVRSVVDAMSIESRPIAGGNLAIQPMLRRYDETVRVKPLPTATHIQECGLYVGNGHHVTEPMVLELARRLGSG